MAGLARRFRIIGNLGLGASGLVQLAHDRERGIDVALKRMHNLGSEAVFRLKQEFRAARDIVHPNLVRLHDLFAEDNETFFTMEPVLGCDLTRFVLDRKGGAAGRSPLSPEVCGALIQLVTGIQALHQAGIAHRDIKPSNVLVDRTGRVVLLDFGFAAPFLGEVWGSEQGRLVGTLPYLAPECLWGLPLTMASDWYSLGTLLAEVVLGRPLFTGSVQQLLRQKDRPPETLGEMSSPTSWLVTPELDALICSLVARDPAARPGPTETLAVLQALAGGSGARVRVALPAGPPPFVGRQREVETLGRFVRQHRDGAVVRVRGPSGVGKTSLLDRVLADLPPDVLVFRGRCHPREQVRFSVLDEVMDQLNRYLRHLPEEQRTVLLPSEVDLVSTLFPVMSRVPGIGAAPAQPQVQAQWPEDPRRQRARAIRQLRDLWAQLGKQHPVVIWIDDLECSDPEGRALLRDLAGREPAAGVCWVFSYQSDPRRIDPLASLGGSSVSQLVLDLTELPGADARALAQSLGVPAACADRVAAEAAGCPFLILALVRQLLRGGPTPEPVSLGAALRGWMSGLPAEAPTVLEYLSLSPEPLSYERLRALVSRDAVSVAVVALESAGLIRRVGGGEQGGFTVGHERLRRTLIDSLGPELLQRRQRELDQVLARRPQQLAAAERVLGLGAQAVEGARQPAVRAARARRSLPTTPSMRRLRGSSRRAF